MDITQCEFIKSTDKLENAPKSEYPEFAFVGRSNVGKSSLINMLTNRKQLAKTSGTPGKTKLINYFLINQAWYLVDLPGYGYAKTSKSERRTMDQLVKNYASERESLSCMFVLIDIRHAPIESDLEFLRFLGTHQLPFSIIFTKADKLSGSKTKQNINSYKKKLLVEWEFLPELFITSAVTMRGREEILKYINKIS